MKPCINCQKNEAEYCTNCIDQSDKHKIKTKNEEKSFSVLLCVPCETVIGVKNVDDHVGHHTMIERVQA